jgi:DNA-binding response OmpR family regulator
MTSKMVIEKPRVIIVDNDPDTTNLLAGVFKLKRMEVFKAPTAEACLEILNYAIILLCNSQRFFFQA